MTVTTTLTGLTTGTWAIDPTHSEVGFVARHLMVTKVRGSFTEVSGTVEVADELSQSVANVVIKTTSVSSGRRSTTTKAPRVGATGTSRSRMSRGGRGAGAPS